MASRARQAPWSWRRHQLLHSSETLLVERAEILTLSKTGGKDCKVIFLWPYFYAVLVFFAKMLQLEKSFSLLFITDLNTASLVKSLWTLHITYLICISNAQVLTKSVKIDQSESIPDPGILERPFVKFSPQAFSRFLSPRFFLRAVFCTAPWLTEHLSGRGYYMYGY